MFPVSDEFSFNYFFIIFFGGWGGVFCQSSRLHCILNQHVLFDSYTLNWSTHTFYCVHPRTMYIYRPFSQSKPNYAKIMSLTCFLPVLMINRLKLFIMNLLPISFQDHHVYFHELKRKVDFKHSKHAK